MGVVIPLISAILAGVVAWLVTLRQGRSARENWVLDKRFVVYNQLVDAVLELVRQAHAVEAGSWNGVSAALRDLDMRHRLLNALTTPDLIAPAVVQEKTEFCAKMMWDVVRRPDDGAGAGAFMHHLDQLIGLMRADLLPKALR